MITHESGSTANLKFLGPFLEKSKNRLVASQIEAFNSALCSPFSINTESNIATSLPEIQSLYPRKYTH